MNFLQQVSGRNDLTIPTPDSTQFLKMFILYLKGIQQDRKFCKNQREAVDLFKSIAKKYEHQLVDLDTEMMARQIVLDDLSVMYTVLQLCSRQSTQDILNNSIEWLANLFIPTFFHHYTNYKFVSIHVLPFQSKFYLLGYANPDNITIYLDPEKFFITLKKFIVNMQLYKFDIAPIYKKNYNPTKEPDMDGPISNESLFRLHSAMSQRYYPKSIEWREHMRELDNDDTTEFLTLFSNLMKDLIKERDPTFFIIWFCHISMERLLADILARDKAGSKPLFPIPLVIKKVTEEERKRKKFSQDCK